MKRVFLVVVLLLTPSMAEAAPKPMDFAYGMPLSLKEAGAVYRLTVPREVYETVTRDDLADIRVFNRAEAVVPHVIRRPKKPIEVPEHADILPIFPLYGGQNPPGKDGLSMRVEKSGKQTSIQVFSDGAGGPEKPELSGYIIDARSHRDPVHELEVTWQETEASFVLTVSVESSRDMTHWTSLVPRATLVRMQYHGHEIRRNRIRVPETQARYYRLTWPADREGIAITEVLAIRKSGEPEQERQWTVLAGNSVKTDGERGIAAYAYESTARLPADRFRLRFNEKNTLAEATLFSRPDREATWQNRQRSVFYHLTFEETTLVQDTASVGPTTDRYWKLAVEEDAFSDPSTVPTVELGWLPHELLFVARGEGPFMLAYGSARLGQEEQGRDEHGTLARMMGGDKEGLLREAAVLSKKELGGSGQLVPPPPPVPWKTWLLWGVLVIGVGVIAMMALSLGKGMNREKSG